MITPVRRVEDLAPAVVARRDIRQHQGRRRAFPGALANLEACVRNSVEPRRLEALDHRARRPIAIEPQHAQLELRGLALDFDCDALRRIHDEAVEAELARQPVDERAKSHALHRAAHGHPKAFTHGRAGPEP